MVSKVSSKTNILWVYEEREWLVTCTPTKHVYLNVLLLHKTVSGEWNNIDVWDSTVLYLVHGVSSKSGSGLPSIHSYKDIP